MSRMSRPLDPAARADPAAPAPAPAAPARKLPSVRVRLAHALLAWSLAWSVAVGVTVWLAVQHEVDELLDDTLQASGEVLHGLLSAGFPPPQPAVSVMNVAADGDAHAQRFAWQVVGARGDVLQRSAHAPQTALQAARTPGFSRTADWHIYGMPLGRDGMLYVAQTGQERMEAQGEVALNTVLATAVIALVGHWLLRRKVGRELEPLQRLSQRLEGHEPLDGPATLGPAERRELAPVHAAIDALGARLARRVAHERAFTAHAAHALRTPLAGIDAQLAVALREAPASLAPRLLRVREATARLQRVVAALLALFRSGAALDRSGGPALLRQPVDLPGLVARLPVESLEVTVQADTPIDADPDLLAAALLNLLDNAKRYGARRVALDVPAAGTVRLADDGPGVGPGRRRALQEAIERQDYDGVTGLGLMLADLVARAHGGMLRLPATEHGFTVEMRLVA